MQCPQCGESKNLEVFRFLDEAGRPKVRITCSLIVHDEPVVTVIDDPAAPTPPATDKSADGLVHQLELYPALEEVVLVLEQPAEYGVVEHLFAQRFPDEYRELWARFGHKSTHGHKNYTLSAYLAGLLGNLAQRGVVAYYPFKGTGRWAYDEDISAWGNPRRPSGPITTWAAYALEHGLDPDRDWPATAGFPAVTAAPRYWAYDNRVHRYTKIHRADCSACNDGEGVHPDAHDVAGEWLGPFESLAAASEAAARTGRTVSNCATCSPA